MARKKKKRLGKGLDALLGGGIKDSEQLLPDNNNEEVKEVSKPEASRPEVLSTLPIEKLQRGQYQPRTNMDEASLQELASSIQSQGIIQPILVRPISEDKYEIIAGERRWRAAQIAELAEVPVQVRDVPDEATLAIALIENIQRENLNPIEEAVGLKRLMDEFELTHEEMAKSVGRSRTAVTNLLRLLNLNSTARELLEFGKLEMGHARALLSLPSELQASVANEVYIKRLSVRQTESLVKSILRPKPKQEKSEKSADIVHLEQNLAERLGTKVSIQDTKGKGKIVIEYKNLDTLDGILEQINH